MGTGSEGTGSEPQPMTNLRNSAAGSVPVPFFPKENRL